MINQHLYERLVPNFENCDERGKLVQLIRDGFSQVNYIYSKKHTIRGGHYHKENVEAFYIIVGHIEVEFWRVLEDGTIVINSYEKAVFKEGDMFCINPFVLHTFNYKEDSSLISFYSKGVELINGLMDIYKPNK